MEFNPSVWYAVPMSSDRLTVSLDEDARDALDAITSKADSSQSELVRRALMFYAANSSTTPKSSNASSAANRANFPLL